MATLRYVDNAGQVRRCDVAAEPVVIGRAPTCQVAIEDETISREHARVHRDEQGRFNVRDLGSRNKTFINGQSISESLLSGGDVLRVGDRVLEFLDDVPARDRVDLGFLTPDRQEPPGCEWIKIKAPLSLTLAQIDQLARLGASPSLTSRPEDIADAALSELLLTAQAERGFIALRGEGKRDLHVIAHRAMRPTHGATLMPVSQTFVYAALLQSVAGRYPQASGQIDPKAGFAATAMVAPLWHQGDIVGVIYVDRPVSRKCFPSTTLPLMAAAGAHVGALMAEASRRLALTAVREGAAWITTARAVQSAVTVPPPGSAGFVISHRMIPGRNRCGDLVDVVHLDERRCVILLADAGGKGVSALTRGAAILTAARAGLHVADELLADPADLFGVLNEWLSTREGYAVLPLTCVGVDLSTGRISYINAGGPSPLLMVAAGRLLTLDQPSLVLGVDGKYSYETTHVDLPEGFRLVCYSDGLVEASAGAGGAFGEARLHDLLLENATFTDPERVAKRIIDAFETHLSGAKPDDDATVLVLAPS